MGLSEVIMHIDNCDRDQLLGHYENAIINCNLPAADKIISLRARLGEPFESYSLEDAEQNIRKRLCDSYVVVLLGFNGEKSSLVNLNVDVINTIFFNIIGSTSLSNFNDLQDWNENLNDKILNKILEDEAKKDLEQMMDAIALKKAGSEKKSDCTIL
jgi:hypothetical protein